MLLHCAHILLGSVITTARLLHYRDSYTLVDLHAAGVGNFPLLKYRISSVSGQLIVSALMLWVRR